MKATPLIHNSSKPSEVALEDGASTLFSASLRAYPSAQAIVALFGCAVGGKVLWLLYLHILLLAYVSLITCD